MPPSGPHTSSRQPARRGHGRLRGRDPAGARRRAARGRRHAARRRARGARSRRPGFRQVAARRRAGRRRDRLPPPARASHPGRGRAAARAGRHAAMHEIFRAHLSTEGRPDALAELAALVAAERVCLLCFEAEPGTATGCSWADALADASRALRPSRTPPNPDRGGRRLTVERLPPRRGAALPRLVPTRLPDLDRAHRTLDRRVRARTTVHGGPNRHAGQRRLPATSRTPSRSVMPGPLPSAPRVVPAPPRPSRGRRARPGGDRRLRRLGADRSRGGVCRPAALGRRGARGRPVPRPHPAAERLLPEGIAAGRGTTFYAGRAATARSTGATCAPARARVRPGEPGAVAVGLEYDQQRDALGGGRRHGGWSPCTTGRAASDWPTSSSPRRRRVPQRPRRDARRRVRHRLERRRASTASRSGRAAPSAPPARPRRSRSAASTGRSRAQRNGIEASPDGRTLLVVNSTTGILYRVDAATGVATAVQLGGATLTAGDGLLLVGRTLYVVRNRLNRSPSCGLGPDYATAWWSARSPPRVRSCHDGAAVRRVAVRR
jgi:hypothetical protein